MTCPQIQHSQPSLSLSAACGSCSVSSTRSLQPPHPSPQQQQGPRPSQQQLVAVCCQSAAARQATWCRAHSSSSCSTSSSGLGKQQCCCQAAQQRCRQEACLTHQHQQGQQQQQQPHRLATQSAASLCRTVRQAAAEPSTAWLHAHAVLMPAPLLRSMPGHTLSAAWVMGPCAGPRSCARSAPVVLWELPRRGQEPTGCHTHTHTQSHNSCSTPSCCACCLLCVLQTSRWHPMQLQCCTGPAMPAVWPATRRPCRC